jgi:hypothetical protein
VQGVDLVLSRGLVFFPGVQVSTDRGSLFLGCLFIDIRNDDLGASFRKRAGELCSQQTGSPGDNCNPAGQIIQSGQMEHLFYTNFQLALNCPYQPHFRLGLQASAN